jgi:oligopeptide/dipeptide ABC transporter ATP-binding protein
VLEGDVPSPLDPPPGRRFHPRCPIAADVRAREAPELRAADTNPGHLAECHLRTGDYRNLDRNTPSLENA